jgi:hypothetical protein
MTVGRDDLMYAVETGMFLLPEVPELLSHIRVDNVRGRNTVVSHPLLNLVGAATLTDADADAAIGRVRDTFARDDKAFGWLVGPSSTPTDLPERLIAAGMVKVADAIGMARTDLDHAIGATPGVRIEEVAAADMTTAVDLMARSYPLPHEAAEVMCKAALLLEHELAIRTYFAYVDDVDEPIGFGMMFSVPDRPIVLLSGAATLEDHRHHGVYTAMTARRLDDARAGGATAAVLQAMADTSAPICRKLGFTTLCELSLYAWIPPTAAAQP